MRKSNTRRPEGPGSCPPAWDCSIAFLTTFPLLMGGTEEVTRDDLLSRLRGRFPGARWEMACSCDPTRACEPPCAERGSAPCRPALSYDYAVAMGFLPLSEATARAVRIELGSPRLNGSIGGRDFQTDLNVILTYHGAAQVATITVNIVVPNCSVDDIVCLRQAVHRYKEFEFTGCEHCPDGTQYANIGALIWSYVTALVSLLDADGREAPSIDVKGTVIEVTRIGDIQSLADAIEHIETHSSHHTEAIVAEDAAAVARFFEPATRAGAMSPPIEYMSGLTSVGQPGIS